jgi:two-component system LytT family response regulator
MVRVISRTGADAGVAAVVVDDEPLALQRVVRLLARDSDISVVGAYDSVAEAIRAGTNVAPDLVLLDVRMPGLDGFDFLRALEERGIEPFVIFVTAYAEHAVAAFDVEAVDFILKPFEDSRFAKALARAKGLIQQARARATGARPEHAGDASEPLSSRVRDRLLVSENGRVLFLPLRDIEFVQAAAKNIKVFAQGHCHLVRQPLHQLEARLDPNQFVRVHRSTIVNVEQIVEMHPLFHGDYELVLKRGTRVPMSRRYRSRMLPFISGPWAQVNPRRAR